MSPLRPTTYWVYLLLLAPEEARMRLVILVSLVLGLLFWPDTALASCTYTTYTFPDGRIMTCSTCCWGNSCSTNCY